MGDSTATRALVSFTVSPDQQFKLTPPWMLTGSGYRPVSLGIPKLTLGQMSPVLSPGPVAASANASPSPSGDTPGDSTNGGSWKVLSQSVMQVNAGNWSFTRGAAAPLPAATLQFNLLFSGLKDHFQVGEYISGSGSFSPDAGGHVYSLSWGLLLGGNDLLVRGPVSFINPQLQVGPNFTNLGRPDASAQIAGNLSEFINFTSEGSSLTVGIGGQLGYSYDFSSSKSAYSASVLMQFQLQKLLQ
jgi:hypothetical protein